MNNRCIIIAVMAVAGLLLQGCEQQVRSQPVPGEKLSLVPAPREMSRTTGSFEIAKQTTVTFSPGAEPVASYFTDLVKRTYGIELVTRAAAARDSSAVRFEIQPSRVVESTEAYELVSTPQEVVVSAADTRGLFYGAVTLWQLLVTNDSRSSATVPAVVIKDAPRFAWRGLMLDSARHFQSPAFIRRFIDEMALSKLNVLHWHLTDDQGWRLQINKYPKLTDVGAWRVPAGAAHDDIDSATGKPRLYGGFYSQQEVRELVAYAAARNITIVPEIEMPGHAAAAVAAYPELGAGAQSLRSVPADWGVYDNLYNVDESTFAFLQDVLTEVIALFPGEYVHIGGDEAVKTQWKTSPRVQARMRELNIVDEHALQSYFVQRMGKFLARHQRRLIGWDEILEGGLAPDATVMSWRGIEGAQAAAAAGHDTVLSPAPTLYFNHRPSDAIDNPPGRGSVVSLHDVYSFDPAPASIPLLQQKHILGVQANIWTEHMRLEERVEFMTFPRAAALAEIAWSPASRIDWQDFQTRLPAQKQRYQLTGVQYASTDGSVPSSATGNLSRTSHELKPCTDKLVLALEDDAPVRGDRAVFLVDIMNPCWIYSGAELDKVTAMSVSVGQLPFNFQIGADIKAIPLPTPRSAAGELEVRKDDCQGEVLAVVSLATATTHPGVTTLPMTPLRATGRHDLCFLFTRATVDPMWVIDRVTLLDSPAAK